MPSRNESSANTIALFAIPALVALLLIIGYAMWFSLTDQRGKKVEAERQQERSATVASINRDATVAARAVRNIRATETREANMMLCVNNPSSCEELGWNRERAREACIATAEARPGLRDFNECRPSYLPPLPTPRGLRPPRPPRR